MIYRLKYAKSESNFDADFEHPTCKGKSFKNSRQYTKLLPLQGALPIAIIPRALPWAKSFCPFRACCFWKLLGLQPVHKPLAKLQLKKYLPSIYGSPR